MLKHGLLLVHALLSLLLLIFEDNIKGLLSRVFGTRALQSVSRRLVKPDVS